MRIFCFVLLLGISSTGCSGCDDDEQHSQEKREIPTLDTDKKRVLVTPALRAHLFDEAGTADSGAP